MLLALITMSWKSQLVEDVEVFFELGDHDRDACARACCR